MTTESMTTSNRLKEAQLHMGDFSFFEFRVMRRASDGKIAESISREPENLQWVDHLFNTSVQALGNYIRLSNIHINDLRQGMQLIVDTVWAALPVEALRTGLEDEVQTRMKLNWDERCQSMKARVEVNGWHLTFAKDEEKVALIREEARHMGNTPPNEFQALAQTMKDNAKKLNEIYLGYETSINQNQLVNEIVAGLLVPSTEVNNQDILALNLYRVFDYWEGMVRAVLSWNAKYHQDLFEDWSLPPNESGLVEKPQQAWLRSSLMEALVQVLGLEKIPNSFEYLVQGTQVESLLKSGYFPLVLDNILLNEPR